MSSDFEAYGKLLEGLHITGYSFERACVNLEWLLQEDRWRLEGRFDDPNAFLDSLRLDKFRQIAEQRKRVAARIKQLQPTVSNRQIARTLGVEHRTIDRDLGANAPRPSDSTSKNNAGDATSGANAPPPELTGAQAAQLARRKVVGTQEKQERRAERERELAAKQMALPDKRYGVIDADPEWRFEPWSRETGMDRAADNHYPTSELEAIKSRDVASIAAADCVLFMWATVPMLPQALEVMQAWSFEYKTHIIWNKGDTITGFWFLNQHELLLVGTKGNPPAPAPGTQWPSVITVPAPGRHSEKPDIFYELIEQYFPNLPKIELNCRGAPRSGWDAWGNEADVEAAE
jgi:N6-adenosine-specific RNA methylase IME4